MLKSSTPLAIGVIAMLVFVSPITARSEQSTNGSITIRWLGHASFRMTTAKGTTIITDPCDFRGYHMPPNTTADIVTVSHQHMDHNSVEAVSGSPVVLQGTDEKLTTVNDIDTTIEDVRVYTVPSFHDPGHHGSNAIFVFEFDGIRVAHMGDIGTVLTEEQIAALGTIDVLMVPVGGQFTIAAAEADTIVNQLDIEWLVLPMHYRTKAFDGPPYTAEPFLKNKNNVKTLETNELILDPQKSDRKRIYVIMGY